MARRRKLLLGIAVLGLLQVAVIAGYRYVDGRRSASPARFPVERLAPARAAPKLALERADGTRTALRDHRGQVVLVHFWATWCPPCVKELPELLQTARALGAGGLVVLAVSLDDDWSVVRTFFAGDVPPEIYRATDPQAHRAYEVSALPDTFLVSRDGDLEVRYGGARPWASRGAREHLRALLRQ